MENHESHLKSITKAYAEFTDMSLKNYTFKISSNNYEGTSTLDSTVFVPSYDLSKLLLL